MKSSHGLEDRRVLVLEDDFYLAGDEKSLLEKMGAIVVGPFGTAFQPDMLSSLGNIDGAVVDINLGRGPTFELARLLKNRGVPFIFVTGYDASIIPSDLSHIERLEKPIHPTDFVETMSRLALS